MIASRTLKVREGKGEVELPIRIHAPRQKGNGWACRIEIHWPDEPQTKDVYGHDSVQALHIALKTIGIHLYNSGYHEEGLIGFLQPGFRGYGFPVVKAMHGQALPDDVKL